VDVAGGWATGFKWSTLESGAGLTAGTGLAE
jgi:hypothetical protein